MRRVWSGMVESLVIVNCGCRQPSRASRSHFSSASSQLGMMSLSWLSSLPIAIDEKAFMAFICFGDLTYASICAFVSQTVRVCWYPFLLLFSQSNIPSAFCAALNAGIVRSQNFIEAYSLFVLRPVTDTYMLVFNTHIFYSHGSCNL